MSWHWSSAPVIRFSSSPMRPRVLRLARVKTPGHCGQHHLTTSVDISVRSKPLHDASPATSMTRKGHGHGWEGHSTGQACTMQRQRIHARVAAFFTPRLAHNCSEPGNLGTTRSHATRPTTLPSILQYIVPGTSPGSRLGSTTARASHHNDLLTTVCASFFIVGNAQLITDLRAAGYPVK